MSFKHSESPKFQSSVTNTSRALENWDVFRLRLEHKTRLWLRTQRFEFRIIDLLPRDEEIESGVKLLKVGILGYLGMNVLHVGCILELGDLDPEFLIAGKLNG